MCCPDIQLKKIQPYKVTRDDPNIQNFDLWPMNNNIVFNFDVNWTLWNSMKYIVMFTYYVLYFTHLSPILHPVQESVIKCIGICLFRYKLWQPQLSWHGVMTFFWSHIILLKWYHEALSLVNFSAPVLPTVQVWRTDSCLFGAVLFFAGPRNHIGITSSRFY